MSADLLIKYKRSINISVLCLAIMFSFTTTAQESINITGHWTFNEKLSDNTDHQVEIALKAAGQKVKKRWWFSKEKDIYRGGPAEQELYDHISYDSTLNIEFSDSEFKFTYDTNFVRPVYTDNRRRSVSLNRLEELEDFSFAHWQDNTLLVEARPRDGGFTNESYTLLNNGTQLKVSAFILPQSFQEPIEIVRIYDRAD